MQQKPKSLPLAVVLFLSVAACVIYAINGGIRTNYGMIGTAITALTGIPNTKISFVLAVANLFFGLTQPFFGVLALKKSNGLVLTIGAVLVICGLASIPFCTHVATLIVFFGIIMPSGLGALSFGMIMGAITPALGSRRAAAVSGIVSASAGIGSTILSPILDGILSHFGLRAALWALCIPVIILIPLGIWLSRLSSQADPSLTAEPAPSFSHMMSTALHSRSYRFLMVAFFTCGFHMAITETHLFNEICSYGFDGSIASYAFSIYGITTILGSLFSGAMISRFPMKYTLSGLFAARPVVILAFLLLPKTIPVIYAFAALLGFIGASTVPPISGLTGKLFGVKSLATLFGVLFVCHQIGSFFSAWFGSLLIHASGTYSLLWLSSAVLAALAAVLSFCVREPVSVDY